MRRGPGDKGEQAGRFTSDGSLSWIVCLEGCREGPWGVRQGNELSGSVIGEEGEFPLHYPCTSLGARAGSGNMKNEYGLPHMFHMYFLQQNGISQESQTRRQRLFQPLQILWLPMIY